MLSAASRNLCFLRPVGRSKELLRALELLSASWEEWSGSFSLIWSCWTGLIFFRFCFFLRWPVSKSLLLLFFSFSFYFLR